MRKIGILNGGGDCAGLNAVIASIVKAGSDEGFEFIGIKRGAEGLLGDLDTMPLDYNSVRGISHLGGTILLTTNKGRFGAKAGSGESIEIDPDVLAEAKAGYDKLGLECIIAIGGDGTLSGMQQLQAYGVNVVAVPKTIDNDLEATDFTFGFNSAVDFVADALDRIHTTAASHNRVIFVETMGRNAGWIALYGGIAGGAEMILIPEFPFTYEKVAEHLKAQRAGGKDYSVVVVAEGAKAVAEDASVISKEAKKESLLGGCSMRVMNGVENVAPGEFEMRNVVLGHLQRGGQPNADDRILAQRFGVAAMGLAKERRYGRMVCLQGNKISDVDLAAATRQLKLVTADHDIVKTAQELNISFGV